MKDMYSFARTEEEHMDFYNKTIDAYMNIFSHVGLGNATYVTSASGGVFTDKFSHEFQTVCDAGEDMVYIHKEKHLAINEEIFTEETVGKLGEKKENFIKTKTAEVGNIFTFGTKKCEELGLYFTDNDGVKKPVYLGSYGVGITRLMGVIAEVFSTEKGMVWPEAVAPFKIHLIDLSGGDAQVKKATEDLYQMLKQKDLVLLDDREGRAGEKFADLISSGFQSELFLVKKL
jgi:prolyl-tRNA synthetase